MLIPILKPLAPTLGGLLGTVVGGAIGGPAGAASGGRIYETRFEGLTIERRDLRSRVDRIEQRDAARSGVAPKGGTMGQ